MGHTLLNRGQGQFEWVDNARSGFWAKGELRSLRVLTVQGQKHLLAGVNGGAPKMFRQTAGKPE